MIAKSLAGTTLCLCLCVTGAIVIPSQAAAGINPPSMDTVRHLGEFQVVEFRRYKLVDGERPQFVSYFEAFFPEAFEQLGAITFGSFTEQDNSTGFVEIRGFHALADRAIVSSEFYYGPLWKEHRVAVNEMLAGDDSVMLLQPLDAEDGVPVLPAMDPRVETQAQGAVIAEIFSVNKGSEKDFGIRAKQVLARYPAPGLRPAGMLVTMDVPNNFPQQDIRTDGPFLVWLGVVKDEQALQTAMKVLADDVNKALTKTGLLRTKPEMLVLHPTQRSRLRWDAAWN